MNLSFSSYTLISSHKIVCAVLKLEIQLQLQYTFQLSTENAYHWENI